MALYALYKPVQTSSPTSPSFPRSKRNRLYALSILLIVSLTVLFFSRDELKNLSQSSIPSSSACEPTIPQTAHTPSPEPTTPTPPPPPPPTPHPPKPSIAIITLNLYNPQPSWMSLATQNKNEYCTKHNYTCLVFTQRLVPEPTLNKAWDKIFLARSLLPLYDYIWLLDADAYITNTNTTIESILSLAEKLHHRGDEAMDILISRDTNALNCGSFFLRNSQWTRNLLEQWWSMRSDRDYEAHDHWYEQAALIHMWEKDMYRVRAHTGVVPQSWINSYPPINGELREMRVTGRYAVKDKVEDWWWRPGDWVMHGPSSYKFEFEKFIRDPFGV
ncbi:hypothetical protein HDV00_004920 [Rhizophlyctis rosea]|nr:hypothetical protein HDV00_004920 [Rhizophlyctis rosea]